MSLMSSLFPLETEGPCQQGEKPFVVWGFSLPPTSQGVPRACVLSLPDPLAGKPEPAIR